MARARCRAGALLAPWRFAGAVRLSVAVSLVIGLLPLSPLDANAFTNYWSHYNSLRIAKGLLWAMPLLAMMLWTLGRNPIWSCVCSSRGCGSASPGSSRWGCGSARCSRTCSICRFPTASPRPSRAMHTGGSEIETYVVTAIPFVWLAFGGNGRSSSSWRACAAGAGGLPDDADHRPGRRSGPWRGAVPSGCSGAWRAARSRPKANASQSSARSRFSGWPPRWGSE